MMVVIFFVYLKKWSGFRIKDGYGIYYKIVLLVLIVLFFIYLFSSICC